MEPFDQIHGAEIPTFSLNFILKFLPSGVGSNSVTTGVGSSTNGSLVSDRAEKATATIPIAIATVIPIPTPIPNFLFTNLTIFLRCLIKMTKICLDVEIKSELLSDLFKN